MLKLSDHQWEKIEAFLRQHPGVYVGEAAACRRFGECTVNCVRS